MGMFSEFHIFLQNLNACEEQTTTLREIDQKIEEGGPDTRYYRLLKCMILERGDPDLDRVWMVTPDSGIETPEESKRRKGKSSILEGNNGRTQ